ncbi:MAG: hypothetical protein ACE5J1_02680, partial [Nitrospiria bacterium]
SAVTDSLKEILQTIPDFSPSEKPVASRGTQPAFEMDTVERAKKYVRSFTSRTPGEDRVDLENIWQVHGKYIVSEIKSGLVIIDQHVAHERVLFEQGLHAMEGSSMPSQALLFPEVVELSPDDFSVLTELVSYLEKIGFRMKEFGKNTVLIEAVPSEIVWGNEKNILKEIIDDYRDHHKEYASFQEGLAASFACRAAVKAGDRLTAEEMQTLIDRLFATSHPYYCPHGRPIIVNLTLDELDRRFER